MQPLKLPRWARSVFEDKDRGPSARGTASFAETVTNLVKCFVGAASFELPWAFMQGGRMGSVLGLLGLAACSFFALSRLAQCAHMVPGAARPTSAGRIWQGFLEGSC